jgi:hypothetical protein
MIHAYVQYIIISNIILKLYYILMREIGLIVRSYICILVLYSRVPCCLSHERIQVVD